MALLQLLHRSYLERVVSPYRLTQASWQGRLPAQASADLFRCLAGQVLTMTTLSRMRWSRDVRKEGEGQQLPARIIEEMPSSHVLRRKRQRREDGRHEGAQDAKHEGTALGFWQQDDRERVSLALRHFSLLFVPLLGA